MTISRRKFMSYSMALPSMFVLSGMTHKSLAENNIQQELILGGGQYLDTKTKQSQHVFSVYDLTSNTKNIIDMDFLPHGLCLKPDAPKTIAIFEKKGPHACEFDLSTLKMTRVIETEPKRYFYGHGAYSADGGLLYCTETYLDGFEGIIAVRDAKTLEYLAEFPTYGKEPHECMIIDNGNTMVVTNGGGKTGETPPSVTYIDIKTTKLIERVELTNSKINTGHMALGQDKSLIVVSAPRAGLNASELGGVSIRNKEQELLDSINQPSFIASRMIGEALSVVIHESSNVAAVTHPSGNLVTFWSIKNHQLLKSIDLEKPRGVALTLDKNAFVFSYSKHAKMLEVDVKTLQIIPGSERASTYITGSHIYNWTAELKKIKV